MQNTNTLKVHVDNIFKQLDLDNGYLPDTDHLDMHPDHQEILYKTLELLDLVMKYKTLDQMAKTKQADADDIKAQISAYLDKYSDENTDMATLIGDLL